MCVCVRINKALLVQVHLPVAHWKNNCDMGFFFPPLPVQQAYIWLGSNDSIQGSVVASSPNYQASTILVDSKVESSLSSESLSRRLSKKLNKLVMVSMSPSIADLDLPHSLEEKLIQTVQELEQTV